MENLRDLQLQARNLERSGQHAAAIELYGRILEDPAADRDGGVWARVARLQLALGQEGNAAGSYATAAERYEAAGLANLALAHCQRALRADEARPETLLRFGRLAAASGYGRDARHGFVEFAERTTVTGDVATAAEALREYLGHFPDDVAVRGRIAELTGEEEPPPSRPPESAAEPLPGLMPTGAEAEEPAREDEARPAGADRHPPEPASEAGPAAVERLEGFEPTHAGDAYAAGGETVDEPSREGWSGGEAGESEEEDAGGGEPLPLLGAEGEAEPEEYEAPAPADGAPDTLPLMGVADETAPAGARDPAGQLRDARERVASQPASAAARRELITLLRAASDPELESALAEAERDFAEAGRAAEALEFVEELARLRPDDTALQQRRVERALRAGNRQALVDAYLALARRLEVELQTERAQEALRRVLELDPANEEARAALTSATAAAHPQRDYVDLGELILSGAPEEVTRFQVAIGEPTGNEESDFAEILDLFRKKVSESLNPKDAASHYDLGLAFKEMGLLDDAIVHLQGGLRGGANPLATLEVLGECFVLKGQLSLAARVFERATRLDGVGDSDLVGVLYGLARCQEELGQHEEARGTFERVVAVDLSFRDAAERLERLQPR